MSVQKVVLSDVDFDAETGEGLCIVCFGEPSDAECRKEHALVEKAAEKVDAQIRLVSCQIENCMAVAERFQVTAVPTLLILKDGREVERMAGFRHQKTLVRHLQKHCM